MKKLLLAIAMVGLAGSVMAKSPACDAPVLSASIDEGTVEMSWSAPLTCTPTKYSIDFMYYVYDDASGGTVADCTAEDPLVPLIEMEESYTVLAPDTTFSFTPTYSDYACDQGSVKVKALTTPAKGGTGYSQNNPFSNEVWLGLFPD